jgi:hypothetical protein
MVPQSEVDRLVVAKKREAIEKYERELAQKQARGADYGRSEAQERSFNNGVVDTAKLKQEMLDELKAEQEAKERAYVEQQRKAQAEQFVKDYEQKLAAGRDSYEDFDDVVGQLDPAEFVDVVMLAHQVDGTADIMYELARNPEKLAELDYMASKSPSQAKRMMQKLAKSIETNREAVKNHQATSKPLPRSNPSTAGTSMSELKSVRDFKNASWLRG